MCITVFVCSFSSFTVLAKQAEKKLQEDQTKKTKGKKRKNQNQDSHSEPPSLKRAHLQSGTPSPLIFSRPESVLSVAVSEMTNGEEMVDGGAPGTESGVGGGGGERGSTPGSSVCVTPVRPVKKIGKTSAPLGGRGKIKKRATGGGSRNAAAASAGAIAGALAANNAVSMVYPHYVSPSPSNASVPSPANTTYLQASNATAVVSGVHHGSPKALCSSGSSPRASPVQVLISNATGNNTSQCSFSSSSLTPPHPQQKLTSAYRQHNNVSNSNGTSL